MKFIKISLIGIIIVSFSGCGGSGSVSSVKESIESNITNIEDNISEITDRAEDKIEDLLAPSISEDAKEITIYIIRESDI